MTKPWEKAALMANFCCTKKASKLQKSPSFGWSQPTLFFCITPATTTTEKKREEAKQQASRPGRQEEAVQAD